MKRQRGRGRKPSNPGNRSHESNGPDVKIRGSASQIYEKYMQYARDAQTMGDRVKAENLFQHAEHYYRLMAASMPKERPPQVDEQPQQNVSDEVETEANDSLKVLDDDDAGAEVVDASSGEPAGQDSSNNASSAEADADAAPKRRRRPRRKPVASEDEGNGDKEAKSALDALAQEQAAIAEN